MQGSRDGLHPRPDQFVLARVWNDLAQDLRFALRQGRRMPGFTALAVTTLAVGIGANASMAGAIDRLLLRPPVGVQDPARVVRLLLTSRTAAGVAGSVSASLNYPTFLDVQKGVSDFSSVAAYTQGDLSFGTGQSAVPAHVWLVSSGFFAALGVVPHLGRLFAADALPGGEESGGQPVAVLGYEFWRRHFNASATVLGSSVRIGHIDYSIIGVSPPGFRLGEEQVPDAFVPITVAAQAEVPQLWFGGRGSTWLSLVARLKDGTSSTQASHQATAVWRDGNAGPGIDTAATIVAASIIPGRGPDAPREARIAVWLGAVSIIVLLIACVNVVNLLLGRSFVRRREFAIRVALGAGRSRLARQLMTEGLLLTMAGALGALVLCGLGGHFLSRELAGAGDSGPFIDLRLLVFVGGIALGVAAFVSLAPLIHSLRANVSHPLSADARAGGGRTAKVRFAFLMAQASICLPLLVSAGLFVSSFRQVARLDIGMDVDHTFVITFDLNQLSLSSADAQATLDRMASNVRHVAGVERVAFGEYNPYRGGFAVAAQTPERGEDAALQAAWATRSPMAAAVDSGFFHTVGAASLRGRDFDSQDRAGSERVAIVNATLAQLLWPNETAIGKCMLISDTDRRCVRIVGVLEGFWRRSILDRNQFLVYVPLSQSTLGSGIPRTMFVRVDRPSEALAVDVQRAIQDARPDLGAVKAELMHDVLEPQYQPWRVAATMFGLFGGVAVVICIVGLYGVVSFNATQRASEIAIRMALGARPSDVLKTIAGPAFRAIIGGLALGTLGAFLLGHLVSSILYKTLPSDPTIVLSSIALLIGVSVVASVIPTARAIAKRPADILRNE